MNLSNLLRYGVTLTAVCTLSVACGSSDDDDADGSSSSSSSSSSSGGSSSGDGGSSSGGSSSGDGGSSSGGSSSGDGGSSSGGGTVEPACGDISGAPTAGAEDGTDWVVNSLTLAESGEGFDLTGDGNPNNSAAQLLTNPLVANALGDVDALIADALNDGTIILLLDSVGWDNYTDDDHVGFQFYIGEEADDISACVTTATDGGATQEDAEETCTAEAAADNFSGSEEFNVACSSFDENGDPLISFDVGCLDGSGGLAAGPSTFVLALPLVDPPVNITIGQTNVTGAIAADGSGLTDGLLGGAIPVDELTNAISGIPEAAQYADVIQGLLPQLADVDTDDDGEPDGISIALNFTATGAVFDPAAAVCE